MYYVVNGPRNINDLWTICINNFVDIDEFTFWFEKEETNRWKSDSEIFLKYCYSLSDFVFVNQTDAHSNEYIYFKDYVRVNGKNTCCQTERIVNGSKSRCNVGRFLN